jgi:hypothetical protein
VRRFRLELWRQKNWLLHNDNSPSHNSFLTKELFYQIQHDYRPSPILLSSVYPVEDKTERPPFLHNWGDGCRITGGSEHPQHDFQDALTKMVESLGTEHTRGRGLTTSRVMVASRLKVSFWPDVRTSPGNCGWLFV